MKKTTFLMLVALIVSACAAPQVTVTSEVTVTLTPTPIPTSHPEFAALQQVISDSGLRFTLQADGLVYDGDTPIPGLTVAPDGTMTLTVDGESVTLDLADVDFDDENGISIKGYEWNEDAGAWVEAVETVTVGGVTMTLDENGVVTEKSVEGNYTPEQQAEKMFQFDATNFGFEPGATEMMMVDGKLSIVDAKNHDKVLAQWGANIVLGGAAMNWDMEQVPADNPVFDAGKVWKMNGVNPVDKPGASADSEKLDALVKEYADARFSGRYNIALFLYNEDGTEAIGGTVLIFGYEKGNTQSIYDAATEGRVFCFLDRNGNLVTMFVKNFSNFEIRYWR